MEYGIRLIYCKNTGKILNNTFGEMQGDLQEGLRPKEIDYLDLPYGYNDNNFKDAVSYHIDVSKDKNKITKLSDLIVITEYVKRQETEEERLRREKEELENQLLLKENENVGGIL
ncbi:hypothetical protein 10S11_41 [uncultured Caudovirales phage]|uniref:Uncharacterized protein n=1 Tax=uncultured Caudovirales phage TaxID=2100421 RepID=A0A2H4J342_9CAUD|nr:hypothetical protein 10S11_41 [uncultured Caudovirales phage]